MENLTPAQKLAIEAVLRAAIVYVERVEHSDFLARTGAGHLTVDEEKHDGETDEKRLRQLVEAVQAYRQLQPPMINWENVWPFK